MRSPNFGRQVSAPICLEKLATSRFLLVLALVALSGGIAVATDQPQISGPANRKDLVSAVKNVEKKLGFRRTKNFYKNSAESAVAYRCYYTGKLELPDSYSGLQLLAGTRSGCTVDTQKYDVFFYPMDANASGKTPVSSALAHESMERFLVVVPHEDFHANKELRKLPDTWGEASATLIGFLTATEVARQQFGEKSEVYQNLCREPELFSRKAETINQFHSRLCQLYASERAGLISEHDALEQKQHAFDELHQACMAISPMPKSFNRCPAAMNNAGLAFDETYTKYYPLMYQLYLAKGRELKPTLDAIQTAMNTKSEEEALQNLQQAVACDK
jgi:predicted aminopeptidase